MATHSIPVLVGGVFDPAAVTADALSDGTAKKMMTAAERTKLAGVATAATANAADAALRDRSTHTGTQPYTTVTGLGTAATRAVGVAGGVAAYDDPRLPQDQATIELPVPALGNAAVFRSPEITRQQGWPEDRYSTMRLQASGNAAYTAKMQASADGTTWTDAFTHTVTASAGTYSIDQTVVPQAKHTRWVFTATAAGMSALTAKVVLA
jgi:hypothetical protein